MFNTKRFIISSISFLLCALYFFLSFPIELIANENNELPELKIEENDCLPYIDQRAVDAELEEKKGQGIVEIESLRERNSKHFQLEDGTYQAIAYGNTIHRKDEFGKWQDIDNRLYEDNQDNSRYISSDGWFVFAKEFAPIDPVLSLNTNSDGSFLHP